MEHLRAAYDRTLAALDAVRQFFDNPGLSLDQRRGAGRDRVGGGRTGVESFTRGRSAKPSGGPPCDPGALAAAGAPGRAGGAGVMTGAARGIICGGGRGATGAEPRAAGPAGAVPGRAGGAVRGAAAGAAGTRAGRADAPPSAWRNQSRMRASSSGVTPANRPRSPIHPRTGAPSRPPGRAAPRRRARLLR